MLHILGRQILGQLPRKPLCHLASPVLIIRRSRTRIFAVISCGAMMINMAFLALDAKTRVRLSSAGLSRR
jgi:hypothetical protein